MLCVQHSSAHSPFTFVFRVAEKLTKSTRLLDLPEHGYHALAPHRQLYRPWSPISASFDSARVAPFGNGEESLGRQAMLAMLLLARRNEPSMVHSVLGRFQVLQVLLGTIAVVGQDRFRTLPDCLLNEFRHRLQLLFVIGCSITDCPTISSQVGSTAACAL